VESRQVISYASGDNQIIFFDERRLVLGLGPVMLPLTHKSLSRLSDLLLGIARDFDRHAKDGRVYIHCVAFVFRLCHDEFLDLLGMVSQALGWLHGHCATQPN
jgi:hypothetical protein